MGSHASSRFLKSAAQLRLVPRRECLVTNNRRRVSLLNAAIVSHNYAEATPVMRTKQSVINIVVSCTSYLILMLCTFITRGVFSRVLGLDYAGVESTFLNLVSMLAIVELGLGTGIIYKLYKPIADGDNRKIGMLLVL